MNYTIGVVTYHARFEKYFKPLIEKLVTNFPDREIVCIINGHPDGSLQIDYLNKVTAYLRQFPNVRYLTCDLHQSLAKCWNQLVILSPTDKILIMNDDTQVTELFREEFENKVISLPFSIMNTSWSHFLISKDIVKKVGWFDERLLGVGHEDADYALRMAMASIPMTDTDVLGLENYVVDEENPGWKSISKKNVSNKYAEYNGEFFRTKWITADAHPEMKKDEFAYSFLWNKTPYYFSPRTNEPIPMFYEFSVLDNTFTDNQKYYSQQTNKLKILFQKFGYALLHGLKKIYRKILN